jgi:hypothetical protein
VHDAIRQRELEEGVPSRVVGALAAYGGDSDDVLWAALFVLAVLIRDNSAVFGAAAVAVARAGGLQVRRCRGARRGACVQATACAFVCSGAGG